MIKLFSLGVNSVHPDNIPEQARSLTAGPTPTTVSTSPWPSPQPGAARPGMKRSSAVQEVQLEERRPSVPHRPRTSFFVAKLWSYFVPTPPRSEQAAPRTADVKRIPAPARAKAILRRPAFYEQADGRPRSSSTACCARAARVDTIGSRELRSPLRQQLFRPPNVAGSKDALARRGTWLADGRSHTRSSSPSRSRPGRRPRPQRSWSTAP